MSTYNVPEGIYLTGDFTPLADQEPYIAGLKSGSFELSGQFDAATLVPTTFQVDAQYRRCQTCRAPLVIGAPMHGLAFVEADGTRCVTPHADDCAVMVEFDRERGEEP